MTVWRCRECSGMWGLALQQCPRCHSELDREEVIMPKASRAVGASNAEGMRPGAVVRVKKTLTDKEAKQLKDHIDAHGTGGDLPFGATVDRLTSEGGEQSSPGTSSSTSSEKQPPNSPRNAAGSRKRARTTANLSSPDQTEGSTAPTTVTGGPSTSDASGSND